MAVIRIIPRAGLFSDWSLGMYEVSEQIGDFFFELTNQVRPEAIGNEVIIADQRARIVGYVSNENCSRGM